MSRPEMSGAVTDGAAHVHEPWYKYGIGVLFLEAAIAVAVSVFAISMGLSGKPVAFKKHIAFPKKPALAAPAPCRTAGVGGCATLMPAKP